MHKILLLDIPIVESYHSLFITVISHLTNIEFSFLFLNWPNFNIVLSQGTERLEERERYVEQLVDGAVRTYTFIG